MRKREEDGRYGSQGSADPPAHLREKDVPMELSLESPNAAAWPRR